MSADIGVKMKLEGEREFQSQLKSCNAELKNMQSALKLTEEAAKGNANSLEALQNKEKALATALEAVGRKQQVLKTRVEELTRARDAAKKAVEDLERSEGKESDKTRQAQQSYDRIQTSLNKYQAQLNNTTTQQIKLDNELQKTRGYMQEAEGSVDKTAHSIDEFGKEVKESDAETKAFMETVGNSAKLDAMRDVMEKVAATFQKVGQFAYEAAKEIDVGYDNIIKRTGATGDALDGFEDIASDVYGSMNVGMDEVGNAIGELNTRFHISGDQLDSLTRDFLQFSKVNGVDVVSSIDDMQNALAAFGMDVSSAATVLDVMTATGQKTGVSLNGLLSTVTDNATALQQMGLDIYQSVDFMGKLATAGADAGSVLSGMKRALKNATAEGKPLNQALSDLEKTIKNGTSDMDGLSASYELFGKSGAAVYQAVKTGSISFTELADSATLVDEAVGSTAKTFDATVSEWDKMQVATNNLKLAAGNLAQSFLSTLEPAVDALTDVLQGLNEWFEDLPEPMQELIGVIGGVAIVAGQAIPTIMSFGQALATMKIASELAGESTFSLGSALKGILSSSAFPLVAVAAGGLIAILLALKYNVDEDVQAMRDFQKEARELAAQVEPVAESVEELADAGYEGADALERLATAQANLKSLTDINRKATKKMQEAEDQMTEARKRANREIEKYNDIRSVQSGGDRRSYEAYKNLSVITNGYAEAQRELNATQEMTSRIMGAAQNQVAAYTILSGDLSEVEKAGAQAALERMDVMKTSPETFKANADALQGLITKHQQEQTLAQQYVAKTEAALADLQKAYDDAKNSAVNSLEQTFGEWGRAPEVIGTSVEEIIANLNSQTEYMTNYAENLKRAAELGVDEGLIKKLSDGSQESAQILQGIVDDAGAHVDEFNQAFARTEEAKNELASNLAESQTDFNNKSAELQQRVDETVAYMNQSDAAFINASATIGGYASGANAGVQAVNSAFGQAAAAVNQLNVSGVTTGYGVSAMQGFANGAASMIDSVASAFARAADVATSTMNSKLQINSPSKVFMKTGAGTMEGLIMGVVGELGAVRDTYMMAGQVTLDAYEKDIRLPDINAHADAAQVAVNVYVGNRQLTAVMADAVSSYISQSQRSGYRGAR